MASTYFGNENLEQFTQQLDAEINAGRNISDVEYADGLWIATTNDGSDSTWSWHPNIEGLIGQIETKHENDYELVDVEYGDGIWFASYEEGFGEDSYFVSRTNADEFTGRIQELGDGGGYRGYDFVDFEYGDGVWAAVLNDGLGGSTHYVSDITGLAADLDSIQAEGYDLVDVEYTGGSWVSVFYDDTGAVESDYAISTSQEQFEQQIAQKIDEGYDLVDIEYGDGVWVGVFDGVIASTGSNSDSIPSTDEVLIDGVIQNSLINNS